MADVILLFVNAIIIAVGVSFTIAYPKWFGREPELYDQVKKSNELYAKSLAYIRYLYFHTIQNLDPSAEPPLTFEQWLEEEYGQSDKKEGRRGVPITDVELRRKMVVYLGEGQFKTLCFDVGLNYDALEGNSLPTKVASLLIEAQKNITLMYRVRASLYEEYPHENWG